MAAQAIVHVDLPLMTVTEHVLVDDMSLRLEQPSVVYVVNGSVRSQDEGAHFDLTAGQATGGHALVVTGAARVLACSSALLERFGEGHRAVVSAGNHNHYSWGSGCDGWRLVETPALAIREERTPAGTAEVPHLHRRATQFFYTLAGSPEMSHGETRTPVPRGSGVVIPPGVVHQFTSPGPGAARFLVFSAPRTAGDRVERARLRTDR